MRMNEGLLGEACNLSSRAGARIENFFWISLSGVDAEGLSWCSRDTFRHFRRKVRHCMDVGGEEMLRFG